MAKPKPIITAPPIGVSPIDVRGVVPLTASRIISDLGFVLQINDQSRATSMARSAVVATVAVGVAIAAMCRIDPIQTRAVAWPRRRIVQLWC